MKENSGFKLKLWSGFHQESAFLVVSGNRRHIRPPPARRPATMKVGAGHIVSKSVAITTKIREKRKT